MSGCIHNHPEPHVVPGSQVGHPCKESNCNNQPTCLPSIASFSLLPSAYKSLLFYTVLQSFFPICQMGCCPIQVDFCSNKLKSLMCLSQSFNKYLYVPGTVLNVNINPVNIYHSSVRWAVIIPFTGD